MQYIFLILYFLSFLLSANSGERSRRPTESRETGQQKDKRLLAEAIKKKIEADKARRLADQEKLRKQEEEKKKQAASSPNKKQ